MPHYRFFLVAQNGHIHEPAIVVDALSDVDALRLAREKMRTGDVEVWQGSRLVAYLTPAGASFVSDTGGADGANEPKPQI